MRNEMIVALLVATESLVGVPAPAGGQVSGPVLVDQIAWVDPPEAPPVNTTHGTFQSPSMDVEVGYSIYLPDGYDESVREYPVVYWLHGRGGSEAGTAVIPVLHEAIGGRSVRPMVLVAVNGGVASGYIDNTTTGVMGESVVIRELIPHIETNYRVASAAAGRGIGGISMGGAGAIRMALRHPEAFGAVISVAGALFDNVSIMERHWVSDLALARSYDPYVQVTRQAHRLRESLKLQMFIGTADGQLGVNRRFRAHLESLGVPYDYLELDAVEHNLAQYLNAVGPGIFEFYSSHLHVADEGD
jgi:enterochelin esterase-like enzyme